MTLSRTIQDVRFQVRTARGRGGGMSHSFCALYVVTLSPEGATLAISGEGGSPEDFASLSRQLAIGAFAGLSWSRWPDGHRYGILTRGGDVVDIHDFQALGALGRFLDWAAESA